MTIRVYLVRRLALMVLVMFGVATITFLISHVIPSNPALIYVPQHLHADQIKLILHQLGFDRPLYVQYGIYMKDLVTGHWGSSLISRTPVLTGIGNYLPATLELIIIAMTIATIVGVLFGVTSAHMKGRWIDLVLRMFSTAGVSVPVFWLAIMLQLLFVQILHHHDGSGWLPVSGQADIFVNQAHPVHAITHMYAVDALITGNWHAFWDAFQHLIMPVLALAAYPIGVFTRITRGSMLEAMGLDYVRMAKAMGMPTRKLLFKAALKNAMGPVLTLMGLNFAYALVGTFFIEWIFAWAGFGLYTTTAILNLDYPVIIGVTVMMSAVYVVVNLIVDMIQVRIDPRITLS